MKPRIFWSDYQDRIKKSNTQATEDMRSRIANKEIGTETTVAEVVTAKEFFVWTNRAEYEDKSRTIRAGKQVRAEILYIAPKWMLDRDLIVDAAESPIAVQEGQSDLLEF